MKRNTYNSVRGTIKSMNALVFAAVLLAAPVFAQDMQGVGGKHTAVGIPPSGQFLQHTLFQEESIPDEQTLALFHFTRQPFESDGGSAELAFTAGPPSVTPGRFGNGVRLASGNTMTVQVPKTPGKGGDERCTIDGWVRIQGSLTNRMSLLRIGSVSLSTTPDGTLVLSMRDEDVLRSTTAWKTGRWHHLSLMLRFRYNDLAEVRVTVNGTPVIAQTLDSQWINLLWETVRTPYHLVFGDGSTNSLAALDLDDIRVSFGDRRFYEGPPDLSRRHQPPPAYLEGNAFNSESGAVSFWFRPVNWDVREHLIWGRKWSPSWGRMTLPMFSLGTGGADFKPVINFSICRELKSLNQPLDLLLNPGKWSLVTFSWHDNEFTTYVNGQKVEEPAPFAVSPAKHNHVEPWTADTVKFEFAGAHAGADPVPGGIRSLESGTTPDAESGLSQIGDFRVYDRFLSPNEIADLANEASRDRGPVDVTCHVSGVKGEADLTVYRLAPAAAKVRVAFSDQGSGKVLAEATLGLESQAIVTNTLQTGPLEFKTYELRWTPVDAEGKDGASLSKLYPRVKPPWHGFKGGLSDKVMPGWDPVTVDGNSVTVWGRTIEFSDSGLPARVISQGKDILDRPPVLELVANGKPVRVASRATGVKLLRATESEAVIEGHAETDANFTIRTSVRIEFDGLMWFDVSLLPDDGAAVEVDRFRITLPYRPENAELLHWWSGEFKFGRGTMRHPKVIYCGKLYEGKGVVFQSNDEERILHPESLRGNFIPYVMLTGMDRGMSWFARNDKGWTIGQNPAVEIERTDSSVNLRLNIINETVALGSARVFAFGLQPIPLKKLDPNWRMNCGQNVMPDHQAGNCLKSKNAQPERFNLLPDDMDWAAVNRRYRNGEDGVNRMLTLHERETERFRERYHRAPSRIEVRQPGIYFNMQWAGNMPEMAREWAEALGYGTEQTGGDFDWWHYSPWFQDFAAWSWDQWLKNTPIEACYFDDTWAAPQKQLGGPDAPAYALPDGHVQPGYQFLEYRERFKRMRRLSYENGKVPVMCIHMTHTYFTPYVSLFDTILEGEDRYPNPDKPFEETRDFLDKWPLDRLRFHHAGKWGLGSAWLGWGERYGWRREAEWYAHQENAYTAAMALHDIAWRFPAEYMATSGFREPDTEFIPYWGEDKPYRSANQTTKLAIWRRQGKCLVLAVNTGDAAEEATVTFDLGALGLEPSADVTDISPELADSRLTGDTPQQEPAFSWQSGQLKCAIKKHEYRLFEIGNRK